MTGSWVIDYFIYGSIILMIIPIIALIRKEIKDKDKRR